MAKKDDTKEEQNVLADSDNANISENTVPKKIKTSLAVRLKYFWKGMKRFFFLWLAAAIVCVVISAAFTATKTYNDGSVSATVNFSFDGIEQGLDPIGNVFDQYQIKSDSNIKKSLEDAGLSNDNSTVTNIKDKISVEGMVPAGIISTITKYIPIVGDNGLNSSKDEKDTSYNPTQYRINFKFREAGYSRSEGAKILNGILKEYENYFYSMYGYNSSLEKAVLDFDYRDYDYPEAVNVIDSSLNSLQNYIKDLQDNDNTRFKSDTTGYTFSDLSEAIATLRSENVGWISSYVESNNITKDKTTLINYYQYRIDDLERDEKSKNEQLTNIKNLIKNYKKTNTVVLGVGNDEKEYQYSQSSDTYDDLVTKKVDMQTSISNDEEQISLYEKRIKKLKASGDTSSKNANAEKYFAQLETKMKDVMSDVNATASEYYKEVKLKDAYQIVNEATGNGGAIMNVAKSTINTSIGYEAALFGIYILLALISGICLTNDKQVKFFTKTTKSKNSDGKKKKGKTEARK